MEEGTGMAEAPVDLGGDEASLWRSRGAGTRRTASSVRVLVTRSPATVEALLGLWWLDGSGRRRLVGWGWIPRGIFGVAAAEWGWDKPPNF